MKKSEVIQLIIKQQNKLILDLQQSIQGFNEDADIDEDALKDSEDFSHQSEAGEMKMRMAEQLKTAKLNLSLTQNIEDKPCTKIQSGALVETDKNNFFIGVSTVPLTVDNKNVLGISTQAPIYFKMNNKTVGDTFEMANISYKILAIS
jgi:hypothetical protein